MAELKTRILIVDDDQRLRDLLVRYLGGEGYEVKAVADGTAMDKQLSRERYDLVVLDLMLPGEDGLTICRRLRGQANAPAIVMLTAKGDEVDRIVGLEMGADDYLPKPFNPRELLARINAVLRRRSPAGGPGAPSATAEVFEFGKFTLHPSPPPPMPGGEKGGRPPPPRTERHRRGVRVREIHAQPLHAHPDARREIGAAHHRRVLGAQGAGATPARADVARQADGARARPRIRGVRPLDRRADLAPAQDRRGGSLASEAHPDRLGLRLRLRARISASVALRAIVPAHRAAHRHRGPRLVPDLPPVRARAALARARAADGERGEPHARGAGRRRPVPAPAAAGGAERHRGSARVSRHREREAGGAPRPRAVPARGRPRAPGARRRGPLRLRARGRVRLLGQLLHRLRRVLGHAAVGALRADLRPAVARLGPRARRAVARRRLVHRLESRAAARGGDACGPAYRRRRDAPAASDTQ